MTTLAATRDVAAMPGMAEEPLGAFQAGLDGALEELLRLPDEAGIDPRWSRALVELRAYALRPAKRVRPTLLVVGWAMAGGELKAGVPTPVQRFAAGLELLHTFMLVHDDVADRAPTRRGGVSLHKVLGRGGEDLAVVLGDHLYARSVEAMLDSQAPHAVAATRYMMGICRHTAVGQYLDLDLSRAPLESVTLLQTLKVANLKTARYGFVAPLVAGAMLGEGDAALLQALGRAGRLAGLAFQLKDDLIGLFGDDQVAGKDGGGDFMEGKRTFPLLAAWTRADPLSRKKLSRLWNLPQKTPRDLAEARTLVSHFGGREATQRVIDRMTRGARRTLLALPARGGVRTLLDGLLARLARRSS